MLKDKPRWIGIVAGLLLVTLLLDISRARADTASNVVEGQMMFHTGCTTCHDESSYMINLTAPSLFGVVGRRVGSVPGFAYSAALQAAYRHHDTWSPGRLDSFLIQPTHMYVGTTMPWSFADPSDRKAMIAYLKSLKPRK